MELTPIPINKSNFAPFGEVIDLDDAEEIPINQGLTTRFHDLMKIDVDDHGGRPIVNVFRTSPLPLPHRVTVMERHPLGSQGFIPMGTQPFLVLVGRDCDKPGRDDLSLFITNGSQGINLKKNTWHHFQIVLGTVQDFLVIDRGGEGCNLEEIQIYDDLWITSG